MNKPFEGGDISWRSLLIFDLFLLALLILASRLATFLHELFGHAFLASTFGGQVNGIKVTLFGGGHVYYHFETGPGLDLRFLLAFGGIIVNVLSGLLPFIFFRQAAKRSGLAFFSVLFGMVSLLGAISYGALGFYYNHGDPVAWAESGSQPSTWYAAPFLVLAPFASYLTVKHYARLIESRFPTKAFSGRVLLLILTLGITGAAYAGLFEWTGRGSVALDAPDAAYRRAKEEVKRSKMAELYERLRESNPQLSDEEVHRLVKQTPIVIHPEEIPKKFPLKLVLALLFTAGALVAIRQAKGGGSLSSLGIGLPATLVAVALAGLVIGVLFWTGEWVYRAENWSVP